MGKASRLKKLRRQESGATNAQFAEKYLQTERGRDAIVIESPASEEKMSQMLIDLAQPLLFEGDTEEGVKKTIGLAALAWNLSLLREKERNTELRELERQLTPEIIPYLLNLVRDKEELFPDVKRSIMSYEVIMLGQDVRVNVISTLQPPDVDFA